MGWTDDEIATAKELLAQGRSYSQVGAAVGKSRCAVGGLAYRHRIQPSPEVRRQHQVRSAKAGARAANQRPVSLGAVSAAIIAERKKGVLPDAVLAAPDAKTLMQLEHGDCRYPVGDGAIEQGVGEQLFCGKPTEGLGPYCPECRVARPLTVQPKRPVAQQNRSLASWIDKIDGRRTARSAG